MAPDTPVLLLTGASGFLGRRIQEGLSGAWRVVGASRGASGPGTAVLDLGDPASIARVFDTVRPAAVVHCGAVADPDEAERDPGRARVINVDATRALARLCGGAGSRLIHLSTDLVFDGEKGNYDEDDAPNPISVYGRTKLAAEEAALTLAPGAVALRVSSCYGRPLGGRTCFVDHLRASLSAGKPIGGFVDQWRSSTAADGLPELISRCLQDPDLEGVFHWGGADRARATSLWTPRAWPPPSASRPRACGPASKPSRPRDDAAAEVRVRPHPVPLLPALRLPRSVV
jgi:dTDP-4-dehydrorhamnose reductase